MTGLMTPATKISPLPLCLVALALVTGLTACGMKGALVLPPETATDKAIVVPESISPETATLKKEKDTEKEKQATIPDPAPY